MPFLRAWRNIIAMILWQYKVIWLNLRACPPSSMSKPARLKNAADVNAEISLIRIKGFSLTLMSAKAAGIVEFNQIVLHLRLLKRHSGAKEQWTNLPAIKILAVSKDFVRLS